jgi:hypothetical protein
VDIPESLSELIFKMHYACEIGIDCTSKLKMVFKKVWTYG